jgi:branched-chain amino acid transport system ATP-binding protein
VSEAELFMSILLVKNLYKDFSGLKVLNGVDFTVEKGEKHALIGPNGAGKSTLFNLITGKYRVSRGKIYFQGQEITGLRPHEIVHRGIARSFQIINIFPGMSVFENIRNAIVSKQQMRFQVTALLGKNKQVQRETEEIMELMGLSDRRHVQMSALSYGEQREMEIALTLALDPELILLDEPTAGLNKMETERLIDLLRRITRDKTVVIVEHDMNVVFGLADRISVLYYGRILATGNQQEIRNNEEVKKAYLGMKNYAA